MSGKLTPKAVFKKQAHDLVDRLPDDAGWRDLIYRAAVRQDIESGIEDSVAGRVKEIDEVTREFGVKDE
jgi:hypothetical protein